MYTKYWVKCEEETEMVKHLPHKLIRPPDGWQWQRWHILPCEGSRWLPMPAFFYTLLPTPNTKQPIIHSVDRKNNFFCSCRQHRKCGPSFLIFQLSPLVVKKVCSVELNVLSCPTVACCSTSTSKCSLRNHLTS